MKTLLKFLLLLLAMYMLTFIPFGWYVNSIITIIAYWTLAKAL